MVIVLIILQISVSFLISSCSYQNIYKVNYLLNQRYQDFIISSEILYNQKLNCSISVTENKKDINILIFG